MAPAGGFARRLRKGWWPWEGQRGRTATRRNVCSRRRPSCSRIYNYFPSKEALFSEAIERERLYFAEAMDARGVFFDAATQRVAAEAPESLEAFEDFLLSYWEPFFADPRVARLRRILVLAAPCNDDARAMLLRLFYDHPLGFAGSMVEHLAAEGAMGQCNPRVAAYEVCGPALTMLGQGLAWSEAQRRLRSQYRAFTRAHSL